MKNDYQETTFHETNEVLIPSLVFFSGHPICFLNELDKVLVQKVFYSVNFILSFSILSSSFFYRYNRLHLD
jgi:hypothetical protein